MAFPKICIGEGRGRLHNTVHTVPLFRTQSQLSQPSTVRDCIQYLYKSVPS